MGLSTDLSRKKYTFTISSNGAANSLSQQAAKIERDQLTSQYTNQLRQLSVQYEQNKIQNETLTLQNSMQLAASQNDIMSQRFASNNQYLQSIQNILNNKLQTANEGTQTYQAVEQKNRETQKGVDNALSQNAPGANTTRKSNATNQNMVDKLASEVQNQHRVANQAIKESNINTEYTNTSAALLSQMASTQRSADTAASNTSSQLASLAYDANTDSLNRQNSLNARAYDDAIKQGQQTIQQINTKYLNDLRNISSISSNK